jgi:hypothetical protein
MQRLLHDNLEHGLNKATLSAWCDASPGKW